MYTPAQFKIEDAGEAHALIRAHPFAILVTQGADGLTATHLPTVLKVDDASPFGRVECHVARPNPQWKSFAADAEALLIFQGPEAYIRPGWYPSKAEHGKAVIINRPFRTGELFERVQGKPLPSWAGEIGCTSWAQVLLKFVLANPAVTCVIPGTSKPEHMRDNVQAGLGVYPDANLLKKMVAEVGV